MTRRYVSPAIRAAEWAAILTNEHDAVVEAKTVAATLRQQHEIMVIALRTIRARSMPTGEIYVIADACLNAIGDTNAQ